MSQVIHTSSKMPPKRRPSASGSGSGSSSGSLSPPPEEPQAKKRKTKPKSLSGKPATDDIWQQITKPEFVDRYRVEGAQDVYYQPEVGLPVRSKYRDAKDSSSFQKRLTGGMMKY
jgi:hypothetical protein